MSSSTAAAAQPPRVIRGGGLKLKGGIVIRAAAPSPSAAQTSSATTKRKQHPDASNDSTLPSTTHPIKSESHAAPSSPPSPPHSPTATAALPSDAPTYVKRTKRADEVEEVNAQLQQLNRATEHKDRRQLIEEDRQRAAQQLTAVEEKEAGGLRLVDVSRGYVKYGFGDESSRTATRRLNEREKKKSDRYCK